MAVSLDPLKSRWGCLQWNDTNQTSPAKFYTTEITQRIVEPISSTLDLCENFGIICRETRWDCFALLLRLLRGSPVETSRWNLFEIGVL